MNESRIAPGLLIAMPQLADPNFERTVILMIEHEDEGSFGIVINRPGQIPVAALLRGFEVDWSGDPRASVGFGGPVMTSTGWLIHQPIEDGPEGSGTLPIAPGIVLSMSAEMLRHLAVKPPNHLRFFMGYAGWGPGQLQSEIVTGSWIHADATPELVFETTPEKIWERALASLGIDPTALASGHGLN